MTVAATIPVRVTVLETWDEVHLDADPSAKLGDLKATALSRAGVAGATEGYLVKYLGAELGDDATVANSGILPNGALVVVRRRRIPVR